MVTRGFYRHYKGHIYFAHGVAELKHEGERRIVIYTSVKTEESNGSFDFLARDEREFEQYLKPDGTPEYFPEHDDGAMKDHLVRRFERITNPEQSIVPWDEG